MTKTFKFLKIWINENKNGLTFIAAESKHLQYFERFIKLKEKQK